MRTPFDESIRTCESLFKVKKIPCRFKLTDSSELTELDKRLSEMGYVIDASALLMSHPAVSSTLYDKENIQTSATPAREWIDFFASHKKLDYTDTRTLRQILGRILPEKRFFWKTEKGKVIACVLAVYERGYTGLFDLFVDEAFRGKKHGLSLLRRALAEGVERKYDKAYLQVDETNIRAISIYQSLGFEIMYRYWYRLKRD
jgi:ribosomal protein S18 acetylase RimI-like enzyme